MNRASCWCLNVECDVLSLFAPVRYGGTAFVANLVSPLLIVPMAWEERETPETEPAVERHDIVHWATAGRSEHQNKGPRRMIQTRIIRVLLPSACSTTTADAEYEYLVPGSYRVYRAQGIGSGLVYMCSGCICSYSPRATTAVLVYSWIFEGEY